MPGEEGNSQCNTPHANNTVLSSDSARNAQNSALISEQPESSITDIIGPTSQPTHLDENTSSQIESAQEENSILLTGVHNNSFIATEIVASNSSTKTKHLVDDSHGVINNMSSQCSDRYPEANSQDNDNNNKSLSRNIHTTPSLIPYVPEEGGCTSGVLEATCQETPPNLNVLQSPFTCKTGGQCDYKVIFRTPQSSPLFHPFSEPSPELPTRSLSPSHGEGICKHVTLSHALNPVPLQGTAYSSQLLGSNITSASSSVNCITPTHMAPTTSATRDGADVNQTPVNSIIDKSMNSPNCRSNNQSLKRPRDNGDLDNSPLPKRMTLASRKRQHQKLASPFRSPLLQKTNSVNIEIKQVVPAENLKHADPSDDERPKTPLRIQRHDPPTTLPRAIASTSTPTKRIFSSAKASSQFKSPLMSSTISTLSQVNNSRKIQELERKVQLLKRAIKIKKENDEEKLAELTTKWKNAGREAAWELWSFVRDNEDSSEAPYPGTNTKSSDSSFSRSWGWADSGNSPGSSGWGWDEPHTETSIELEDGSGFESPIKLETDLYKSSRKLLVPRSANIRPTSRGVYFERRQDNSDCYPDREEEDSQERDDPKPSKSPGTMLHQLGISHHTLGWNEEEGDFLEDR